MRKTGRIYAFVLTAEGFRREFVNGLSGDKLALPVIRKEVSIWQEEGRGALSSSTTVRCICAGEVLLVRLFYGVASGIAADSDYLLSGGGAYQNQLYGLASDKPHL